MTDTGPEDPENARALVAQALCQYVATLSRDHTPIAMALVLPALLARALSESKEGKEGTESVYRETSGRLLELASADQDAFRAVVAGMGEGQRGFLEEVIRSGRQEAARRDAAAQQASQPSIALKMDFGG